MIRAGKLQPPAIQSSVSEQIGRGSNRRWMNIQWQVTPAKLRSSRKPPLWQNSKSHFRRTGGLMIASFVVMMMGATLNVLYMKLSNY
jgi:hypothetical protein